MIDRIVLFKLRDDLSNPAGRVSIASELEAVVRAEHPMLSATIGLPADAASERSWDLAITLICEPPSSTRAGAEDALIAALGDRLLLHKAWSFERWTRT
jgi:hypothetical protein